MSYMVCAVLAMPNARILFIGNYIPSYVVDWLHIMKEPGMQVRPVPTMEPPLTPIKGNQQTTLDPSRRDGLGHAGNSFRHLFESQLVRQTRVHHLHEPLPGHSCGHFAVTHLSLLQYFSVPQFSIKPDTELHTDQIHRESMRVCVKMEELARIDHNLYQALSDNLLLYKIFDSLFKFSKETNLVRLARYIIVNFGSTIHATNETCCICLEHMDEGTPAVILRCHHSIHRNCWNRYVSSSVKCECPVCRNCCVSSPPEFHPNRI